MAVDFVRMKKRLRQSLSRPVGWAIRNRKFFAAPLKHSAYIDVGCASNFHEDFYHIDYVWRPGLDLCWDVTRGLPFPNEVVSGIFTEHCIEHIAFDDFLNLAREFHRVLMPNGRLRIIVPDGELYVRRYLQKDSMPLGQDNVISGVYTPFMSINRVFYGHGHLFIYDFETLCAVLARAGFRAIERTSFRQGRHSHLLIDSELRAAESLYVEATK
jgi:predicted SAM-dependent methyltransferase